MTISGQKELFSKAPKSAIGDFRLFAKVVFNRPIRTEFTYGVPAVCEEAIKPGKRVLAPFGKGNHRTLGYCVGVTDEKPVVSDLKALTSVADDTAILSPTILELTRWMAEHYVCGWGQVLESVLPRGAKSAKGSRWKLLIHPVSPPPHGFDDLPPKQRRAYDILSEHESPMEMKELYAAARCSPEVVRALLHKGLATMSRERVFRSESVVPGLTSGKTPKLTPAQNAAVGAVVDALHSNRAAGFLLHGVTGSGKTEVYLQAIAAAVRQGRQSIVLVPEISLTPQTIQRFRERFERVAILHSRLTDAARGAYWRRIVSGDVDVVIGARSAVFAPCPRLGVLVVDEEHETTFKQDSTPRYHARTVAEERVKLENAVLLLGSATPSLEAWESALAGRTTLLSLPDRVEGRSPPTIEVVDMRQEYRHSGFRGLSRPLITAMNSVANAGGQTILLLNRRGFATNVFCPQCGHAVKCRHCDVVLIHHRDRDRLICHQCDEEYPTPDKCEACGGKAVKFNGIGTEKLEAEVRLVFPSLRVARMDGDTMRSLRHYEKTLDDFREGRLDVLLGTQMIAKGLDFPNVQLVGVVSADTALHLPDFRAGERTFQLVAQVAGRAGRSSKRGRVVVQTFSPEDPTIRSAIKLDFHGFAASELRNRKEHGYPPYRPMCRIIVRSKTKEAAERAAAEIAVALKEGSSDSKTRILGPAPCPIAKLQDFHRFHLQVHAPTPNVLHRALHALDEFTTPAEVETAVDVDPQSFL
jgi:primosomal protein N' (replication factor Y) (superfamily II helicase)